MIPSTHSLRSHRTCPLTMLPSVCQSKRESRKGEKIKAQRSCTSRNDLEPKLKTFLQKATTPIHSLSRHPGYGAQVECN